MPTDAQFPISVDVFADQGLVYWIDSSARHILSNRFTAAEHNVIAKLPPGYKRGFIIDISDINMMTIRYSIII